MTGSIESRILHRIIGKKKGWVFTPSHFLDLGNRASVDQALSRLVRSGDIRRLARGLYDYPKNHPDFGSLPPSADRVAAALAEKDNLKIQPSGAYAANLLGLSEQVPAKVVFLTDGSTRIVQVGNRHIKFKKTTPKNMATAGKISGLVFQALRFIGLENIDEIVIRKLNRLPKKEKKILIADLRYAPAWMEKVIRRLQE